MATKPFAPFYPGSPADGAKVAIVSHQPMKVVNVGGSDELPPGNFLAVDAATGAGPLRVIGMVVRWKEIGRFLDALPDTLDRTVVPGRTVVAGDFNLRVPGGAQSGRLEAALDAAGLSVRTGGDHAPLACERPLIDHIAASRALRTTDLEVWPRRHPRYREGTAELTDHAGTAVTVHMP